MLLFNSTNARVVYTETFNNYTFGLLGVDFKAKVPGQGGWFTDSSGTTQSNSPFTIVSEPGRGMVFDVTSPLSEGENFIVYKTNLNPSIANRTVGNDVLKFEIDYFTGSKQPSTANNNSSIRLLGRGEPLIAPYPEVLAGFLNEKSVGSIAGSISGTPISFDDDANDHFYLPFNTWVKVIIYLDYKNRKVYFDIPSINKVFAGDFLKNSASTNLLEDHIPDTILLSASSVEFADGSPSYTKNRNDDIKITALSEVPAEVIALNTNEQLAKKFDLYPNPATNIVNINSSENMAVKQVNIYDIAGKLIITHNFNNEADIQLNVETLTIGIYMLHLQTDQGIAVKKLIKN